MESLQDFQRPFARTRADVSSWRLDSQGPLPLRRRYKPGRTISLKDTIVNAGITALIGVTGKAGLFDEASIQAMAARTARPIIFPLSNPTSHAEATPAQIEAWTQGRAIIGVGSPFPPIMRAGASHEVDQINNAYIFPGIALGTLVSGAKHVSEGMILASAKALAALSPTRTDASANLLPPISQLRATALAVAKAVAVQAQQEGLAPLFDGPLREAIRQRMWTPAYMPYKRAL
jgi:malate dehydrogenase (oxaloacetate-decarboxylating)